MKILFIGNSHTYMNDMPELARQMIENATGEACDVFMLAYSGRSLKWHIEEEYFSERFNILHGRYDYCVIQEQAHPMPDEVDTVKYAGKIIELCRRAGTTPIIFETWAERGKFENQIEMNRRYKKLAKNQKALLAPIGEVWEEAIKALQNIPNSDLYFRDGAHASAVGDYLAAMVLTAVITGKIPDDTFVRAFDFTVPEVFQPVKESVSDEIIEIPEEIVKIIRNIVSSRIS
ncbi:MAG: hypothetical protein K5894_14085 [Lachnospiraceae bacterium]|nr:hypothetical protein [Lachnospiraceae bacterium]